MRDISGKPSSLRKAKALAIVTCSQQTLEQVKADTLPKGNMLDVARSAGLLASKNTHHLIPHCHPVSIDALKITYSLIEEGRCAEQIGQIHTEYGIAVLAGAKSVGRTGIEMEVLTAVSVSALTIYDLLKPLGDDIEITSIRLLEKTGGKSNLKKMIGTEHKAAVLICMDSPAVKSKKNRIRSIIEELLKDHNVDIVDFKDLPNVPEAIRAQLKEWAGRGLPFVFTIGGTGLGPDNRMTDVVRAIIERETPGIVDAMELHGIQRTPLAMMSRLTAGILKSTLIVTLPGSSDGLRQSLEGILPGVFYAKKMLRTS